MGRPGTARCWGGIKIGVRDEAIRALAEAGMRGDEIRELCGSNVVRENGVVYVVRWKENRTVQVELSGPQGQALMAQIWETGVWRRRELLFTTSTGSKLTRRHVRRIARRSAS